MLFSKKNALILALAVCFSLYQFNKHHQKASRASGAYQIGSAKRLISRVLDPWKYELVQGKNKQDDEVLLVLRRDSAPASASRAGAASTSVDSGSTSGKRRPPVAPVVAAEIIADKRMARANQRRARDPRARAERGRRERHKNRERRSGRGGARKKGGRLPWRHGHQADVGGRGAGRGAAHGGRRRGGRRGRVGDSEFYLDAPPALRMEVYDPALNQLKLMLAKRGLIDKDSVADLMGDNGADGENNGGGVVQRRKGAHASPTGEPAAPTSDKGVKKMTAEQLTKEIMESEEAKRKALESKRVEEERAKTNEEERKGKEEARKAGKKRQKEEVEVEAVVEVAPDGSAREL